MTLTDKFNKAGLELLGEHHDQNDPYVDDRPSARHYATEHRKTCDTCKLIDSNKKAFLKLMKANNITLWSER